MPRGGKLLPVVVRFTVNHPPLVAAVGTGEKRVRVATLAGPTERHGFRCSGPFGTSASVVAERNKRSRRIAVAPAAGVRSGGADPACSNHHPANLHRSICQQAMGNASTRHHHAQPVLEISVVAVGDQWVLLADARTPCQPLIDAITSGSAPKKMNTRSPGRRSHSMTCERVVLMYSMLRACQ